MRLIGGIRRRLAAGLLGGICALSAGTAGAYALALVASPVLTRLYSPADFGAFVVYTSISSLFIPLVSGRYWMAIMLPESHEEAWDLFRISWLLTASASALLLAAALLVPHAARADAGWRGVQFLPFSVLAGSVYQAQSSWATRHREFRLISASRVVQVIAMLAVQTGAAATGYSKYGLFLGDISGWAAASLALMLTRAGLGPKACPPLSLRRAVHVMVKYKAFPLYTTGGGLLTSLSVAAVPLMLKYFYGAVVTGLYALSFRVIQMPASLVGQNISTVIYEEGCRAVNTGRDFKEEIERALTFLVLGALATGCVLGLASPWAFGLLFGERWLRAGQYVQLLTPLFLTSFVAISLSTVLLVYRRQRLLAILQGVVLLCTVGPLAFAGFLLDGDVKAVLLLSLSASGAHLIFLIAICRSASLTLSGVLNRILAISQLSFARLRSGQSTA